MSSSPGRYGQIAAAAMALPPLTTVAHDLRGPLQALALSAELLLDAVRQHAGEPADPAAPGAAGPTIGADTGAAREANEFAGGLDAAQVARLAATIQRQVLWLQGLVENLQAATSFQEGGLTLSCHPLDLREVVAGVQPVVLPLLAHKRQPLEVALPPALPLVSGDGRRLGQVLVNLLLNASKYSPPGGPIAVAIAVQAAGGERRPWVRVQVADRGPGLPPGAVARLFAPYTRAAGAHTSEVEGMGLGLAIVRELVRAHGGRVGAEQRPGGGACFWFELSALAETSAQPAGYPEPADGASAGQGERLATA